MLGGEINDVVVLVIGMVAGGETFDVAVENGNYGVEGCGRDAMIASRHVRIGSDKR